jgi:hypothetical protein
MEQRTWWIDDAGNLRTPGGTKIARREAGRLLFFDPLTNSEVPMTAADWETIFAQPAEAAGAVRIDCHCGEPLTMTSTAPVICPVCGRVWQMSPLQPWAGTKVKVLPCRS